MCKTIFIAGSINTDVVIHAPYMPEKGETLKGSGFFTAHGGKGANQAVAAARLGGRVRMCGCIGDDAFGQSALGALTAEGIDASCVRTVRGVPTGTAVIVVASGDNRIILDGGANEHLEKADIDRFLEEAREGDIFLTQLENPLPVAAYGLTRAREKGMYVILNPAPADPAIAPWLGLCDAAVPNETEAEILGGAEKIAGALRGDLIVTLGSKGYAFVRGKEKKHFSCPSVKAVDTTAAGDTFCGGLAAKLAAGEDIFAAAKFAAAAASLACTRKGAQPSIPRAEEIVLP